MAVAPEELHEVPPPTPAPPELIERATALVRSYPECFWFWHPEASIRYLVDVRLVVEHLREYGAPGGPPRNCTNASYRSTKRHTSDPGPQSE